MMPRSEFRIGSVFTSTERGLDALLSDIFVHFLQSNITLRFHPSFAKFTGNACTSRTSRTIALEIHCLDVIFIDFLVAGGFHKGTVLAFF